MDTRDISVTLPNSTVYVSGIVNEVSVTFTLTGTSDSATIWTANVARASTDIYVCTITAIASNGSSTTIETTLYYGILSLITDRTEGDVTFVQKLVALGFVYLSEDEIATLQNDLKGAYNASDLNRVESAVQYLANRMIVTGNSPPVDVKTVWTNNEWVTENEATRYLRNIEMLRNAFVAPSNMPKVPQNLDDLTYQEANDIERILEMLDLIITNVSKSWYYSNDLFSGEV